jgi:hypothetical protein
MTYHYSPAWLDRPVALVRALALLATMARCHSCPGLPRSNQHGNIQRLEVIFTGRAVFDIFRKKNAAQEVLANAPVGKMLDQVALAVAVSESVGEHVRARNGRSVVNDENASVQEIWNGVRLEVISELWRNSIPLDLLIDPAKHPKLLDAIIKRSESCFWPMEPKGDEIADTISAILRIYDRLAKLDHDVCSPYFWADKEILPPYGGFFEEMMKLHLKWQGFIWAIKKKSDFQPPVPDTVFVVLWRHVTYRSKMIALCARFGPTYLAQFAASKELVVKRGESVDGLDDLMVRILTADDPDHL